MQDRFLIHLVSNGNTAHGVKTYIKVHQAGTLTKPVGEPSCSLGNFSTSFRLTVRYSSEDGYLVCWSMRVHKVCTISRLALERKTPVSTATWTLPEKVPLSGILNNTCQLIGTPVGCGRVVLLVCKIIIICILD